MKAKSIYLSVFVISIFVLNGCSINQKKEDFPKENKIHFVTETKSIAETQLTINLDKFVLSPDTIFIPSSEVVNLEINNKDLRTYKIIAGNIFNVQKDNFTNNLFSKTNIDVNLNKKGKNNLKLQDHIKKDFMNERSLLIPADEDISFTFSIDESKIGEWQIAVKSLGKKNSEWKIRGTIIVN